MRRIALVMLATVALTGCGLNVQSPDLFLLTRTGQGKPLTLLVNDAGTVRCNGGKARQLPDQLLVQARSLASDLNKDAKHNLRIRTARNTVATYTIKLQDGTIRFPDTAAGSRHELAQVELFTVQAAQQACGITA